jgi:hypothetical protein
MKDMGWIGVDLDGTLAKYEGWKGTHHVGEPIPLMVQRVADWLGEGREVRILTARVSHNGTAKRMLEADESRQAIRQWCLDTFGQYLPVTNEKDFRMVMLWDDRAVTVEMNTGRVNNDI